MPKPACSLITSDGRLRRRHSGAFRERELFGETVALRHHRENRAHPDSLSGGDQLVGGRIAAAFPARWMAEYFPANIAMQRV